jgi:integrase
VALLSGAFLAEMAWDPARCVLAPPNGHRLVVRPVCRVGGCSTTATNARKICLSCQRRLRIAGLGDDEIGVLPAPDEPTRLAVSAPFSNGPCEVAACVRQRRHPDGLYCEAHQMRLRAERRRDPDLDEARWRRTDPAIGRGGEVSLRGLEPLVVAQVLYGLQQRCLVERVQTKESDLRAVCDDLRRQRVGSVAGYVVPKSSNLGFLGLANSFLAHARRAISSPEIEVGRDEWDLVLFGHSGTVSFVAISQPWLREAIKAWAADDLPRRRVRPGRRTSGGLSVRHHVSCVALLSESIGLRSDHGTRPAALGRSDVEAFLNRLAYLTSTGRMSTDARIRAVREVRGVLSRVRAMGLTRPGGVAGGLGDDFVIGRSDVPAEPEPSSTGRDLPPEVMSQLCAHLDGVSSPETRCAIALVIDTGRRPEEICNIAFDCLERDNDGLAVLVFDNHKAGRLGRRLPIAEVTAQLILIQQARVRAWFPATPVGELKLLPTDRRNPDGRSAITPFSLAFAHRRWVTALPPLRTADGVEFDKTRVVLYAYRHSYAQRHADAGVGIDVLRELMDHRKLDTTKSYYRVGESRRRDAVDRVAALVFDRNGNRAWQQVHELVESEHARRAIGEVAVPFGLCTEPSNVVAGGTACPYRFRCAGCDHFRTDVSYLPDLGAYLDDLLRNRERLLASSELDEWARREAMPSEEEISRIRRLISRIKAGLEDLGDDERASINEAVKTVRRHRAVAIGMPRVRRVGAELRLERHQ